MVIDCEKGEDKRVRLNRKFKGQQVSEMSAYRVGEHNNTSKTEKIRAKRQLKKKKIGDEKKKKKHDTNDARTSEKLLDRYHTNSGMAGICCTDEATRKRGIYRQKSARRASRTDT